MTQVGEREGDLYEDWASVPDATTDLRVRARKDRRLVKAATGWSATLSQQPCEGTEAVQGVDSKTR